MMTNEKLQEKLIETLSAASFAQRYYAMYERFSDRKSPSGLHKADWDLILKATGLEFRYFAKEGFFRYERTSGPIALCLNLTVKAQQVEAILEYRVGDAKAGGPFAKLARVSAQLRNPSFSYNPPSPKLLFGDRLDLQEVVQFVVEIFEEIWSAVTRRLALA